MTLRPKDFGEPTTPKTRTAIRSGGISQRVSGCIPRLNRSCRCHSGMSARQFWTSSRPAGRSQQRRPLTYSRASCTVPAESGCMFRANPKNTHVRPAATKFRSRTWSIYLSSNSKAFYSRPKRLPNICGRPTRLSPSEKPRSEPRPPSLLAVTRKSTGCLICTRTTRFRPKDSMIVTSRCTTASRNYAGR